MNEPNDTNSNEESVENEAELSRTTSEKQDQALNEEIRFPVEAGKNEESATQDEASGVWTDRRRLEEIEEEEEERASTSITPRLSLNMLVASGEEAEAEKSLAEIRVEVEPTLNELVERAVNVAHMNQQIVWLRRRGEQLNDVKQSIKQLNDQIKDELLIDFSELNALLRLKLEEITDKIKEKLKDAYTVVRDSQARILGKLGEIDAGLQAIAQGLTTSDITSLGTE